MCSGHAPELETKSSFVGRWMDILRPGFARVQGLPEAQQTAALEKEAVLVSLENLLTFPFVRGEVEAEMLTLHGLWTDTGEGGLEQYDPGAGGFVGV
jgi:carbonic anhydrase